MIVITYLDKRRHTLFPGDSFNLKIKDGTGGAVVISEKITVMQEIDFVASFRFALEDGTCPGFHLMGIFANSSNLPGEIQGAKMLSDLTPDQLDRFIATVGTKINGVPK